MDHRHAIRSHASITLYLLLGIATDATRSRSFFLRSGLLSLGLLSQVAGAMKLVLICLQEVSKRSLLIDEDLRKNLGTEATSGFLSRMMLLFLRPIFATGFRKELVAQHMGALDPDLSARLLHQQLRLHWNPCDTTESSRALLTACIKAWKLQFGGLVFSRLVVTAFNFSQPFVFHRVLKMVKEPHSGENDTNERAGLLGGAAAVFLGLALSQSIHTYLMNRFVTRVRGALTAALIHKEHGLSETEAKKSAAATLMTADMEGIVAGIPRCLQIPIGFVEIGLGTYVLSRFIGTSALTVFPPVIASTSVIYFMGKRIAKLITNWNEAIEERMAKTTNILTQLTNIKMLGLGPTVAAYLQRLRDSEIEVSKSYRRFQAAIFGPMLIGDLMTPVAVLASALFGSALNGQMSAAKVFPILTVVALIQRPLAAVLETFPRITGMMACFTRIQSFLMLPDRIDPRSKPEETAMASSESSSVARQNNGSLVQFTNADLAPLKADAPLLRGLNFELPKGSISGLVGTTGGGKSTVVQGLLGQCQILGGSVRVDAEEVAYRGENVWLRDATIRENVIGELKFDRKRFNRAVKACCLDKDISFLTDGEDYVVGTNGSNLSGGQKQKLGLARTAYAQYSVTVLDDVFSSLDHETAVHILRELCGPHGIFREAGCTVLLVFYLPESLKMLDQLMVLENQSCLVFKGQAAISKYNGQVMATLNPVQAGSEATAGEQCVLQRTVTPTQSAAEAADVELRRKGDLRLYLLFINPIGRISMMMHGIFVSVFASAEIVPEIYLRVWTEIDPDNTILFIGYASIVSMACLLGCMVYWTLFTKLAPRSSSKLHQQLVDTTVGSTLYFLSTTKMGKLLNRYSQDMTLLSRDLPGGFLRTVHCGTNAVIQMAIILAGATYLAGVLPAVLIVLFYIQRYYLRTSR